ncbi:MAG: hypothetical protein KY469_17685 [Actinobacteria bacterium]|nr:hypothetical protein [Actinomycetota bacterium]
MQRPRRHRAATTILALLVAAPVLLAATTSAPPVRDRARHARPDAVTVTRGDDGARVDRPTTSPGRLVARSGAPDDPATHARAVRALAAATTDLPIPTTLARETAAEEPTEANRFGVPAGDLDGDDLTDVLVTEYVFDTATVHVVALSGADGSQLWRSTLPETAYDAFAYPAGDLDGDDADDIVVESLVVDQAQGGGECLPQACLFADGLTYSWSLQARRGGDGSELWSHEFDGQLGAAFGEGGTGPTYVWEEAVVATNAGVFAIPAGDLDGDGAAELLLNRWDLVYDDTYGELFGPAAVFGEGITQLVATSGEVLDGATGTSRHTRTSEWGPQGGLLWPAGDLDGDGGGDLTWETDSWTPAWAGGCAYVLVLRQCGSTPGGGSSLEVVGVDGATFADLWSSTFGAYTWVFPGGDFDGDGATDLMLHVWLDDEPWVRTGVVSGRTGATLWTRDVDSWTVPVGPIGGAPGDDLVLIVFDLDDRGSTLVTSERVDGATGDLLFVTGSPGREDWDWMMISTFGDGDADGVGDILFEVASWNGGTVTLESGRTGDAIHDAPMTGWSLAAGDVNANGATDLLTMTWGWDPVTSADTISLEVTTLPDGAPLWSATVNAYDLWPIPVQDLAGDVGDDLVVSGYAYGETYESRVAVRDGRTGTERWGYGDELVGGGEWWGPCEPFC